MPKFKPKDIIAALVIIGIFYLKIMGIDGNIDTVLALILGYYFVKRQNGADNGH